MKKLILCLGLISSFSALAGTCHVQGYGAVKTTSGEVVHKQRVSESKFRKKS